MINPKPALSNQSRLLKQSRLINVNTNNFAADGVGEFAMGLCKTYLDAYSDYAWGQQQTASLMLSMLKFAASNGF